MMKRHALLWSLMALVLLVWSCSDDNKSHTRTPTTEKILLPDLNPETPYKVKIEAGTPLIRPDDPGGYKIYVDVLRPDAPGKFPALMYATSYRREFARLISSPDIVKQGYALVLLDVYGTGSSEGGWEVMSDREIQDIVWIIDSWIPEQEWSNGKVGMYGPSYMGLATLHSAGRNPEHLKAIFPQMVTGDIYRDIFLQGGIYNQQFIYFLGRLAIELSLLLPTQLLFPREGHLFEDIESGRKALEEHHAQEEVVMSWFLKTVDSAFFDERTPMSYWDGIAKYPTLITAGWWDLFTRGSMLNFTYLAERKEHLSREGIYTGPLKIIVGPWYHANGALGGELPTEFSRTGGLTGISRLQMIPTIATTISLIRARR